MFKSVSISVNAASAYTARIAVTRQLATDPRSAKYRVVAVIPAEFPLADEFVMIIVTSDADRSTWMVRCERP